MITAPKPAITPPAAAFVPVRLSMETVSEGPDGATGEWMRGEVTLDIDLRSADTPGVRPTNIQMKSTLADGTTFLDWNHDLPTSPAERAAATAVAQAFEGSNMLKQSVPFEPSDLAAGNTRLVMEDAAGTKLAYTEPIDSPDHPGDAKLTAAINAYTEALGFGSEVPGLT